MSVFSQLGYIFFSILFWSHLRFLFKKSTQISTITESNLFRNFFEGNFQSLKIHFYFVNITVLYWRKSSVIFK